PLQGGRQLAAAERLTGRGLVPPVDLIVRADRAGLEPRLGQVDGRAAGAGRVAGRLDPRPPAPAEQARRVDRVVGRRAASGGRTALDAAECRASLGAGRMPGRWTAAGAGSGPGPGASASGRAGAGARARKRAGVARPGAGTCSRTGTCSRAGAGSRPGAAWGRADPLSGTRAAPDAPSRSRPARPGRRIGALAG